MATLVEKNGYWHMVFPYKDENGKWKKLWETTGLPCKNNKRKAQEMLAKREKELGFGGDCVSSHHNVEFLSAMSEWLDNVKSTQIRENTLCEYKRAFDYSIKSYVPFHGILLRKVTPSLLQGFYTAKCKEGLSANSVHKIHSYINGFLKYAVSMDWIVSNPAERVSLPRKAQSDVGQALNREQVDSLLALFHGDTLEFVVYLAVVFGLRLGEICGLYWSDVDFDNKRIYIHRTAVLIGKRVEYVDRTKTARSKRSLHFGDGLAQLLTAIKAEQERQRECCGDMWPNSPCVCIRADGVPFHPNFVSHHFSRIIAKSDLPKIRFHDLRHTNASLLHSCGYDIKALQSFLGHSNISTTANIYTHMFDSDLACMSNDIQSMISPLSVDVR